MRSIVFAIVVVSGCLPEPLTECANGLLCPTNRVCDVKRNQCVNVDQITACAGSTDGAVCTTAIGSGVCDAGVCVEAVCGDGYVTGVEACDDGNTVEMDGCSADCSSSERCGNGVVDTDLGENCDCGDDELAEGCVSLNSDTPGTTCKANCILQCGDGVINAVEDCDTIPTPGGCAAFGFDRGPLTCSDACANDISECGEFGLARVGGPGLPGPVSEHWIAPTGESFLVGGPYVAAQIGSAWTIQQGALLDSWLTISGTDATFVVAAGVHTSFESLGSVMMQRWDGSRWQAFTPPSTSGGLLYPYGLHVGAATDIVVVGTVNSFSTGASDAAVFSWNGTQWTRDIEMAGTLVASTEIGGGDLVAVGNDGLVAFRRAGVWSTETIPGAPDLRAVWSRDGVVVAVGVGGAIVRYSVAQDAWTVDPPPSATTFRAIAGRSPSDLYASSTTQTGTTTFIAELWHYDGRAWFPMEVDAGVGQITTLRADAQGTIIGQGANFTGYRFTPGGWGSLPVNDLVVFGPVFAAITGVGDTVFASSSVLTYRYKEGLGLTTIGMFSTTAMHALAEDEVYIAGVNGLDRFDGAGLVPVVQRCPNDCASPPCAVIPVCRLRATNAIAVWAGASGHVVFVIRLDDESTILFERTPDEIRTEVARSTTTDPFVAVSGVGGVAYALTRSGWVWTNQSGTWMPWTRAPMTAVTMWVEPESGDIFVGGDDGAIAYFSGTQWIPMPTDTHERINSIHGSSRMDVFATTQSTVQHFDGTRWSPVRAPGGVGEVWTTNENAYFVDIGTFRRLERPTPW